MAPLRGAGRTIYADGSVPVLHLSNATITGTTTGGGDALQFANLGTVPTDVGTLRLGTNGPGGSPNRANSIGIDGGTLPSGQTDTWTQALTYTLNGYATIAPTATLSLAPGSIVLGNVTAGDTGLYVQGTLLAQGTASAPITFTSAAASPSAGDWTGVFLDGASTSGSQLSHVVFQDAGRSYSMANYWTGGNTVPQWGGWECAQNGPMGYGPGGSGSYGCINAVLLLRNSSATLSNLTLSDSNGAGLYLQVSAPALSNMLVQRSASYGIMSYGNTIAITASSIVSNTGGGLWLDGASTLSLVNSTVIGNRGSNGGGISNSGALTIANDTISGNSASSGGGIYSSGTVVIKNTIIAGNTDSSGAPDCYGTFVSQGYSLVGNGSSCNGLANGINGDQVGTNTSPITPLLGSLQDNGGAILTEALLTGSTAINAGDPAGCTDAQGVKLSTDERGYMRPDAASGRCDMGAYEVQSAVPTITPIPTGTPPAGNLWDTTLTELPAPLARPAMTTGADGQIYVFGGAAPGGTVADTVAVSTTYIYNPGDNTWTSGAPLPTAREGAQAITLSDGRIVVLGGGADCSVGTNAGEICAGGTVFDTAELYDPTSDTWSDLTPMPSPRYRFAAVLFQDKIYLLGGTDGQTVLTQVDIYDPQTDTWSSAPALPQPLLSPGAATDSTGKVDVVGGFNGQQGAGRIDSATLWRFDGTAWTQGASLPAPAEDLAVTPGDNGLVYAIGGYNATSGYLASGSAYNPTTNSWTPIGPLPGGLCCGVATTAATGQLIILGGQGAPGGGGPTQQVASYGAWVVAVPDFASTSTPTPPAQTGTPTPAVQTVRHDVPAAATPTVTIVLKVNVTGHSFSGGRLHLYLQPSTPNDATTPGAMPPANSSGGFQGQVKFYISRADALNPKLKLWVWNKQNQAHVLTGTPILPPQTLQWTWPATLPASPGLNSHDAVQVTAGKGWSISLSGVFKYTQNGGYGLPITKAQGEVTFGGKTTNLSGSGCTLPAQSISRHGLRITCTWQLLANPTPGTAKIQVRIDTRVGTTWMGTSLVRIAPQEIPPTPLPQGDGATTIYGLSGTFSALACGTLLTPVCGGEMSLPDVSTTLNAAYARFPINIPCQADNRGSPAWWDKPAATYPNTGSLQQFLSTASTNNIIPVLNLVPEKTCRNKPPKPTHCPSKPRPGTTLPAYCLTPSDWLDAANSLVAWITTYNYYPSTKAIYLEVGNEPNLDSYSFGNSGAGYQAVFHNVALALDRGFRVAGYNKYLILTAGWSHPTPDVTTLACSSFTGTDFPKDLKDNVLQVSHNATSDALNFQVDARHLGYAIHPYGYRTNIDSQWPGFAGGVPGPPGYKFDHTYCNDLPTVLSAWLHGGLPVIITEDNFVDDKSLPAEGAYDNQDVEGAYFVDLATWLRKSNYDTTTSKLRVLWFRGQDTVKQGQGGLLFGLYTQNVTAPKTLHQLTACNTLKYNGPQMLPDIFSNISNPAAQRTDWLCTWWH